MCHFLLVYYLGIVFLGRGEGQNITLLRTPTYGRAKAGRPARTYIQQLCEDTGCSPEDLPDREKWRERARDTRASGTTWWWWWWVWMVSTCPLISISSGLFTHLLGTIPSILITIGITVILWRCPWCNGYRRREWTRRHEFKSWTRLIAFHIALIPLGKVWIQ